MTDKNRILYLNMRSRITSNYDGNSWHKQYTVRCMSLNINLNIQQRESLIRQTSLDSLLYFTVCCFSLAQRLNCQLQMSTHGEKKPFNHMLFMNTLLTPHMRTHTYIKHKHPQTRAHAEAACPANRSNQMEMNE